MVLCKVKTNWWRPLCQLSTAALFPGWLWAPLSPRKLLDRPALPSPWPVRPPAPPPAPAGAPLLEGDLGALGQPTSSVLELGVDLAYLNCALQPHHFQPLVT